MTDRGQHEHLTPPDDSREECELCADGHSETSLSLTPVGISWTWACFVQRRPQLKIRHPLLGEPGSGFLLEGGC